MQTSESYTLDSNARLIGSGGTCSWLFKAVKAGSAKITMKYYRDWEGEASASAENTKVYYVTVR